MLNSVYFYHFTGTIRESSAQMLCSHLEMTFLLYRAFYVDLLTMHPMAENQIQKVKGEILCILAKLHEIYFQSAQSF